jgi:hypothetical protein
MATGRELYERIHEFLDLLEESGCGRIGPMKRDRYAALLAEFVGDERLGAVTEAVKQLLVAISMPGAEEASRQVDLELEQFNEQRRRQ